MQEFEILSLWRSVPLPMVALAWSDEGFKDQLLRYPSALLKKFISDCPEDMDFCVMENTKNIKNFVIPYRHPDSFHLSEQQIIDSLNSSVSNIEYSLEYGLPVSVIVRVFSDYDFRQNLILNPVSSLESMGYTVDAEQSFVHENTDYISHMILPYNKWHELEYPVEQLEKLIIDDISAQVYN